MNISRTRNSLNSTTVPEEQIEEQSFTGKTKYLDDGHTAKRTTETVVEFVLVEHRLNSVGLFGWLLVLFFVTSDDVWMLSEAVKALQQCLC